MTTSYIVWHKVKMIIFHPTLNLLPLNWHNFCSINIENPLIDNTQYEEALSIISHHSMFSFLVCACKRDARSVASLGLAGRIPAGG